MLSLGQNMRNRGDREGESVGICEEERETETESKIKATHGKRQSNRQAETKHQRQQVQENYRKTKSYHGETINTNINVMCMNLEQ